MKALALAQTMRETLSLCNSKLEMDFDCYNV